MKHNNPNLGCDTGQSLLPISTVIERLSVQSLINPPVEIIAIEQALGRVLAEAITARVDVPPADNSAMDGYALCADDWQRAVAIPVSQRIPAGVAAQPLQPKTVARIFTGAMIPEGATAVVMQEQCTETNGHVIIDNSPSPGMNIRRKGEDIVSGSVILKQGHHCQPQSLGLLASVGISHIKVYKRIKVALLTTGNELCMPGNPLVKGQIYNSNRFMLIGLLEKLGCEWIDLGIVKDTFESTCQALLDAADQADLIISSGGVSVGEEDYIKKALDETGHLDCWRLNMKPGKPLAFGFVGSTYFLGLPGNPVSVFSTFAVFAKVLIKALQGITYKKPYSHKVIANFDWPNAGSRDEFLRVKFENGLSLYPYQGSGVLTSTVWATGFAFVPANTTINKGDLVEYFSFNEMFF